MADRARRSIQLNLLEDVVRIFEADVRDLPQQLEAEKFDVVTTNPPYRSPETGRIARSLEADLAWVEPTKRFRSFSIGTRPRSIECTTVN